MEIWCYTAMCFHLIVYKQQDFSRFTVEIRRRLSEDEMKRVTGMLRGWPFTKGRCQYTWGIPDHCRQDVKPIPDDWKCLAGPRRRSGTSNDYSPGPIYCPSGQAPTVLECYDLT